MRRRIAALAALFTAFAAPAAALTIGSGDFPDGGAIPLVHNYPRCGGENISPRVYWSDAPAGTKSFVLTMIDADVKPAQWSHWIVVNLPPQTWSLDRAVSPLPGAAKALASNFGDLAYDGPCPPKGSGVHHYRFTIWAMPGEKTALPAGAKATDVTALLEKTALAHATLTGTVER